MSTTTITNPDLIPTSVVSQFLTSEKLASRRWLRTEMESLMDPLLDQLFDQLRSRFADYIAGRGVVTGSSSNSNSGLQGNQGIIVIKDEIDNDHHVQQQQAINNSSSSTKPQTATSLTTSLTTSIDQSVHHSNPQSQQQVHNFDASHFFQQLNIPNETQNDDLEEDDHHEDVIDLDVNDYDDDHDDDDDENTIEWLDDFNVQNKRQKTELHSQSQQNAQLPKAQQKNQHQDSQVIALGYQCPECDNDQMFPEKSQLFDHLKLEHSIEKCRCLATGCTRSFPNRKALGNHFKVDHAGIDSWPCGHCNSSSVNPFNSYSMLHEHHSRYHQFGRFQCASCDYIGDCRGKVKNHYAVSHKQETACKNPGCHYRTSSATLMKAHERAHLGIKPYQCSWPDCSYANSSQNNTMIHIRRTHFMVNKKNPNLDVSQIVGKPKDYLRVVLDHPESTVPSTSQMVTQSSYSSSNAHAQIQLDLESLQVLDASNPTQLFDLINSASQCDNLVHAQTSNVQTSMNQHSDHHHHHFESKTHDNPDVDEVEDHDDDDDDDNDGEDDDPKDVDYKTSGKSNKRQRTDQRSRAVHNNQDKNQVITLQLICSEHNCGQTFPDKAKLFDHLKLVHSIERCRCLASGCNQSFTNRVQLANHFKTIHPSIHNWPCNKPDCTVEFSSYSMLAQHNSRFHLYGQFRCSSPNCIFVSDCRGKVANHYTQAHKQELTCHYEGCHYHTTVATLMKSHQRAHLGIKPYRCGWPNCGYANASQNNTMIHIKRTHFVRNRKNPNLDVTLIEGAPKDYLEVASELL